MTSEEALRDTCRLLRADDRIGAGRVVAAFTGQQPPRTEPDALVFLRQLLQHLLDTDRYEDAALILWGENVFSCQPRCTQMVWRNFKTEPFVLLQGAGSMSKSYGGGAWLLLDWVRDPEHTTVKVVGPSEQHLEDNLFSHLVKLHQEASIPLPGLVGKLFIGLDPRQRRSSLTGVVIPVGKKSGRLQGSKPFPRKKEHLQFGKMSRLRVFIDEFELVPTGVLKDIENLMSTYSGKAGSLLIAAAYNPNDIAGPAGTRAEPVDGWGTFDIEKDEEWRSKRGWKVVRLDAARCENVIAKAEVFPGLQTYEGYQSIIRNSGGTESAGYYTFCRAAFPVSGTALSVIPQLLLDRAVGEVIWRETPRVAVGIDIALLGGDTAKACIGACGMATGVKRSPSLLFPLGEVVRFRSSGGQLKDRFVAQVNSILPLPRGETLAMAQEAIRVCRLAGAEPDWVTLDRTGNGAGVHDMVMQLWSAGVCGVNFSQRATERRIVQEDRGPASTSVANMVSELWVALRKWMDYGRLVISPAVSLDRLGPQVTGRRMVVGKKDTVESKEAYTSRSNPSPDEADAVTLFLHSVRMASGELPALSGADGAELGGADEREQRGGPFRRFEGGVMVGVTDRFEGLNEES